MKKIILITGASSGFGRDTALFPSLRKGSKGICSDASAHSIQSTAWLSRSCSSFMNGKYRFSIFDKRQALRGTPDSGSSTSLIVRYF